MSGQCSTSLPTTAPMTAPSKCWPEISPILSWYNQIGLGLGRTEMQDFEKRTIALHLCSRCKTTCTCSPRSIFTRTPNS